jgi:hypothetical protein
MIKAGGGNRSWKSDTIVHSVLFFQKLRPLIVYKTIIYIKYSEVELKLGSLPVPKKASSSFNIGYSIGNHIIISLK